MMLVKEQVDILRRLIEFYTVKRIGIKVERPYPFLEERSVGFIVEYRQRNLGQTVETASLHIGTHTHHEPCLHVRMSIHCHTQRFLQPFGINVSKSVQCRNIILRRILMCLPVKNNTALVLSDGIAITLLIGM